MKQYKQIPEPKWWKQSMNSRMYRIREYSAVFILIWAVYMLLTFLLITLASSQLLNWIQKYEYIFLTIGLLGAIIHSITWFFVTPKTLPIKLTPKKHIFFFLIIILIWLGISAAILITL